ncbi:MAG: hypothetical protein IT376_14575, partial [Polyangiaceae bacterium]|nr:hypothetical protein [Polyangiaceae bacterium]
ASGGASGSGGGGASGGTSGGASGGTSGGASGGTSGGASGGTSGGASGGGAGGGGAGGGGAAGSGGAGAGPGPGDDPCPPPGELDLDCSGQCTGGVIDPRCTAAECQPTNTPPVAENPVVITVPELPYTLRLPSSSSDVCSCNHDYHITIVVPSYHVSGDYSYVRVRVKTQGRRLEINAESPYGPLLDCGAPNDNCAVHASNEFYLHLGVGAGYSVPAENIVIEVYDDPVSC